MARLHVLFLVPYPQGVAPSQRFRVEQFLPALERAGICFTVAPFMDEKTWQVLYGSGHYFQKIWGVGKGILKRFYHVLFFAHRCSHVFIHREAAPLGPPILEWMVTQLLRKRLVYDFDDAIWVPNTTRENKLVAWVKWSGKVKQVSSWAYKVAAGNTFLASWAAQYNRQVELLPTCVDVVCRHNRIKDQDTRKVTIGWTGSHSTMKYLDSILPYLQELAAIYNGRNGSVLVDFVLISNKAPHFELERMRYLPWNEKTEIEDLLQLNIGIMPLKQDAWSEGKCGFKLIQYLALGIPAVASPVGVNKEIVTNGVTGFLCIAPEDWMNALQTLIIDIALRKTMGAAGREKIEKNYSVQAHATRFLGLFD
jgi:glycosyltransferase involved in cell wall biosynthesis